MARIPVYEQRTQQSGQIRGGNPTGQSAITDAANNLSRSIERTGGIMEENRRLQDHIDTQKVEDRAAVDVANVLSKGDVYWQQQLDERTKAWKVGDPDLREGLSKDYDAWVAESKKALPTEKSRNFFERSAASMNSRLQTNAYDFQD